MADTQTTVTNLDVQLLDAERSNTTTVKLDNPRNGITREQVSAAMQPAFTNGWFLSSKGETLMYLGNVTINQSIKTILDGQDFYVTPSELTVYLGNEVSTDTAVDYTVTCSGATIQGYDISEFTPSNVMRITAAELAENGLSVTISILKLPNMTSGNFTRNLYLIIQGVRIAVPFNIRNENPSQ